MYMSSDNGRLESSRGVTKAVLEDQQQGAGARALEIRGITWYGFAAKPVLLHSLRRCLLRVYVERQRRTRNLRRYNQGSSGRSTARRKGNSMHWKYPESPGTGSRLDPYRYRASGDSSRQLHRQTTCTSSALESSGAVAAVILEDQDQHQGARATALEISSSHLATGSRLDPYCYRASVDSSDDIFGNATATNPHACFSVAESNAGASMSFLRTWSGPITLISAVLVLLVFPFSPFSHLPPLHLPKNLASESG